MPNHHHGILVKCLMGLPVAGSSLMLCAYFIEFMPTLMIISPTSESNTPAKHVQPQHANMRDPSNSSVPAEPKTPATHA